MLKGRQFFYLVDGLTEARAEVIRKALRIVPDIRDVQISVGRGMVEVRAIRNVQDEVSVACDVAGAKFRTRAKL